MAARRDAPDGGEAGEHPQDSREAQQAKALASRTPESRQGTPVGQALPLGIAVDGWRPGASFLPSR
jgi:hypothetical protein